MLLDKRGGALEVERIVVVRRDFGDFARLYEGKGLVKENGISVRNYFRRAESHKNILNFAREIGFGQFVYEKVARRNVGKSQARVHAVDGDGANKVVALFVQNRIFDNRAGSDYPYHRALDHFARGRLGKLFAHRYFFPSFDEPCDVCIGGMIRHAAHRRAPFAAIPAR